MSNINPTETGRGTVAVAIITGTITTALGVVMLITAALQGASPADFSLELGTAVGLSGVLWKCASHIRRERPKDKIDWSALLLLLVVGSSGVVYASQHGMQQQETWLTIGAAFVTLWLFCLLERQFVLEDRNGLPAWVYIMIAPAYPIVWWLLRGLEEPHSRAQVTALDVKGLLDELRLEAELGAWDSGSPYGDPEYMRKIFETRASDVRRRLGLDLPPELVELVNEEGGKILRTPDGRTITIWTWPAVHLHPVDLPYDVVIFGEEGVVKNGQSDVNVCVFGIDLRPGPLFGTVVRGELLLGNRPEWPVLQPFQIVGASFKQWKESLGDGPEMG